MHIANIFTAYLLLLLSPTALSKSWTRSKDAVLLSKVRTLTVQANKQTSHRRVSAIPQLTCVGGSGQGLYKVDVMRCQNSGSEYDPEDIQWTCKASLPPEFKLGSTDVVCEGYDSPDDPYILKGSCGVEYRLVLTELGEEKYGRPSSYKSYFDRANGSLGKSGILSSLWRIIFWVIFLAVLYTLLQKVLSAFQGNQGGRRRLPRGGWGGGGGGGGFDDDPPPPYTPYTPRKAKTRSQTSSARSSRSGGAQSWQPGFWTGLATGAGAGYFMGNRGGRNQERDSLGARYGAGPSNYGGGGGSSWGGSSGAPGPSSSRQESTGFGGTRRR